MEPLQIVTTRSMPHKCFSMILYCISISFLDAPLMWSTFKEAPGF